MTEFFLSMIVAIIGCGLPLVAMATDELTDIKGLKRRKEKVLEKWRKILKVKELMKGGEG